MRIRTTVSLAAALMLTALTALADNSVTAYGTYWDADDPGKGAGLRLKRTILAFAAVDGRAGYVNFDNIETDMIPLELSLNARLPFFISPYIGVGAGYYVLDSNLPGFDSGTGYFGQVGVEATFLWFGVMAEARWHDMEQSYFDATSYNLGLLIKW